MVPRYVNTPGCHSPKPGRMRYVVGIGGCVEENGGQVRAGWESAALGEGWGWCLRGCSW